MSPHRILIAEDDDDLRDLLTEVLSRGHVVVALEDGFELADYLELTRMPGTRVPAPDLIVSISACRASAGSRCSSACSAAGRVARW